VAGAAAVPGIGWPGTHEGARSVDGSAEGGSATGAGPDVMGWVVGAGVETAGAEVADIEGAGADVELSSLGAGSAGIFAYGSRTAIFFCAPAMPPTSRRTQVKPRGFKFDNV